MGDKFDKDEFVDRTWTSYRNIPKLRSDYVGIDIIPNDVCPVNMDHVTMIHFDDETKL